MEERSKRILAAIMFTDIAGFTTLMQSDETRALSIRARHLQAVRMLHEEFGGRLIKHLGDGTLSIFPTPSSAIDASVKLQQEMNRQPSIPLRIGLHLDEIIQLGEDIAGSGVNLASRIESFSIPGAVLVSPAVEGALRAQGSYSFRSLGHFILKNVSGPIELFALTNQGLVEPKASDLLGKGQRVGDVHNLPNYLTSFIGREKEIEEIKGLLRKHRLITILGPGGTGKSRLATRLAKEITDQFPDGVYWIELAPVSDPEQVVFAIAKGLGIAQDPFRTMEEVVKASLKDQRLLLILDNFEQIIGANLMLERLLSACPQLKILITSRILLDIMGEIEFSVAPLRLPAVNGAVDVEKLWRNPSVQLFCERAQAVKRNFQLTSHNGREVAKICIRLDGLPLAIELAAVRIKIFPPKLLLKKLSDNLKLLRSTSSSRPSRHQTLRQTISWSYDLLEEEEQQLFQRLAVFVDGATLEAVEEICGQNGLADWDVVEGLMALVNKSLVRTREETEEPRYFMLETIREFADESLQQSSDPQLIKESHAGYYLALAERAQPQLTGPQQRLWFGILEQEHANLKAAIHWCTANGKIDWAYRFGIALWRFWMARNLHFEGRQIVEGLLRMKIAEVHSHLRLQLLRVLGGIYMNFTHFLGAIPIFEEIIQIYAQLGEEHEVAVNQNNLAWSLMFIGKGTEAEEMTLQALNYFETTNGLRGQCLSYNNLGCIYYLLLGRINEGIHFLEKSLELRKQIGDERGIGFTKAFLGPPCSYAGKEEQARQYLAEAMALNRDREDYYMVLATLGQEWCVAFHHWDMEQGKIILAELEDVLNKFGYASLFHANGFISYIQAMPEAETNLEIAVEMVENGLALTQEYSHVINFFQGWQMKGFIYLKHKQYEQALQSFREGLAQSHRYGNVFYTIDGLELTAVLFAKFSDWELAAKLFGKVDELRREYELVMPPRNKSDVQRAFQLIKENLQPAAFQKAYEIGKQLTKDEAVELATRVHS